jgi:transcriptional regulator with PAS, ATPase and Fis domain
MWGNMKTAKTAPTIVGLMSNLVGVVSLKEAQKLVRATMVEEALARSEGKVVEAAKLLGVSHQAVSQMKQDLKKRKKR